MNKPSVDFALSFTYKILKPSTDLANGTFADGQKKQTSLTDIPLWFFIRLADSSSISSVMGVETIFFRISKKN